MERSRVTGEKIIAALLDLIHGGNLSPTSKNVAQYAGVGHRTVVRHFQDMESLFEEMNAKTRSLAQSVLTGIPTDGPLQHRIEQTATVAKTGGII